MDNTHPHIREEDQGYRALLIPVDSDRPLEIIDTEPGWQGLAKAIGAQYIERVLTRLMPVLPCGCRCILIVDETGAITNKDRNNRATRWYSHPPGIRGTVLMIAEGPTQHEPYDFISLPIEIRSDWPPFNA